MPLLSSSGLFQCTGAVKSVSSGFRERLRAAREIPLRQRDMGSRRGRARPGGPRRNAGAGRRRPLRADRDAPPGARGLPSARGSGAEPSRGPVSGRRGPLDSTGHPDRGDRRARDRDRPVRAQARRQCRGIGPSRLTEAVEAGGRAGKTRCRGLRSPDLSTRPRGAAPSCSPIDRRSKFQRGPRSQAERQEGPLAAGASRSARRGRRLDRRFRGSAPDPPRNRRDPLSAPRDRRGRRLPPGVASSLPSTLVRCRGDARPSLGPRRPGPAASAPRDVPC